MKYTVFILSFLLFSTAHSFAQFYEETPLLSLKSKRNFEDTSKKLEAVLKEEGFVLMNQIAHHEGAEKAGMKLRPTSLFIFGNPEAGTLLMQCDQRVGAELPLKMLVWEDEDQIVKIAFYDVRELNARYDLSNCEAVINSMYQVLAEISRRVAN